MRPRCDECGKELQASERSTPAGKDPQGNVRYIKYESHLAIEKYGKKFCSEECFKSYDQKAKAGKFLGILEKIDSEREKALKTFDRRIGTLNSHKNSINELRILVQKYKQEGKHYDEIIKLIDKIKKEIITEFVDYINEEMTETEKENLRIKRDEAMMKEIGIAEHYDYQKLRKMYSEGGQGAEEARKHIIEMMQSVQEGIKKERLEIEIEEHLSQIMEELEKIIKQQKEAIREETIALQSLRDLMEKRQYKVEEADIIMGVILKQFEQLYGSLYGEKIRVIIPFEKFLKEKRTIENRVKKYKERGIITKEEIFRDIQTMRTSSEVAGYIRWLMKFIPEMIEKGADKKKAKQLERLWGWLSALNVESIKRTETNLNYMKKLAYKDDKFDVFNKRAIEEKLAELAKKYKNTGRTPGPESKFMKILRKIMVPEKKKQEQKAKFIIVTFDIDNFKTYNDTYSYEIGDKIIGKVISIVKTKIKKTDFFARYGGEEFAIIFEGAEKEKIFDRMDDIRSLIFYHTQYYMKEINMEMISQKHNPPIFDKLENYAEQLNKVAKMKRGDMLQMPYITISMGVTEYPTDTGEIEDWEKIKNNSEQLLHLAKESPYKFWNIDFSGRNQICKREGKAIKCVNPSNSRYSY